MRTLSFIFVLIFAVGASAQSYSVRSSVRAGTEFAKAGDFEKARTRYRAAFDAVKSERVRSDFLARLHYNIGVCEYRLDRPELAVTELEQAVELKSDYPIAFYALGMAESARQNYPKARLAFLAAVRSNKNDAEAWFDLAFVYLAENDLAGAEAAFRNAVAYNSIDASLGHNNIGVMLALRGETAAAIKEFETALRTTDGKLVEAKSNLEYCRSHAGQLSEKNFTYAVSGRR